MAVEYIITDFDGTPRRIQYDAPTNLRNFFKFQNNLTKANQEQCDKMMPKKEVDFVDFETKEELKDIL